LTTQQMLARNTLMYYRFQIYKYPIKQLNPKHINPSPANVENMVSSE
jgi:hypothetical protein